MVRIKIEDLGSVRRTRIGEAVIQDIQFVQHSSGKYFTQYLYKDLIDLLVKDMHRNIAKNYDNVLMATGGEGSGKSSLLYDIISKYKEDWDDVQDLPQTYTYNMDLLRQRFADEDFGNGLFWMDETTQIASNRDWQSQDNKDFISILETFRSKKFGFFGAAPKIERVDVYLRDFRMRYQVHVQPMAFPSTGFMERGIFELKKRNNQSGEMEHVGYGLYPDMPKAAKEIYLPLKDHCQDLLRQKITTRNSGDGAKYKKMYEQKCVQQGQIMLQLYTLKLMEKDDLMQLFGYDNVRSFENAIINARKKQKEGIF